MRSKRLLFYTRCRDCRIIMHVIFTLLIVHVCHGVCHNVCHNVCHSACLILIISLQNFCTKQNSSLVPRPRPAFRRLQYGKTVEGLE